MRTLKAGIALALLSSFLLAPLSAATRQDGVISGSASAEVKKPRRSIHRSRARREHEHDRAEDHARRERRVRDQRPQCGDVPHRARQERPAERRRRQDRLTAGPYMLQDDADQLDLMIKKDAEHSLQPSGGCLVAARRSSRRRCHGRRRGRRQRRRNGAFGSPNGSSGCQPGEWSGVARTIAGSSTGA